MESLSFSISKHFTHPKGGAKHTFMIRAFTIFSKLNFLKLSEMQLYSQAMQNFSTKALPCPFCGAKHPSWCSHADYERYLISFEDGIPVYNLITINRKICSSCDHTHAILPEILIPHSSYGLLFILRILHDYYGGTHTVAQLCNKYQVSISTLYAWKHLFLLHKKLWLGILEDMITTINDFLSFIPSLDSSDNLHLFFRSQRFSFLEGVSKMARSGYP